MNDVWAVDDMDLDISENPDPVNLEPRYEYTKLDKLPKGSSFVCKKGDIDKALKDFGVGVPFHEVWMTVLIYTPSELAEKQKLFHVALASSRSVPPKSLGIYFRREITRSLNICSVPREYAFEIRQMMKQEGLRRIITWFNECSSQPETWQWFAHHFRIQYDPLNTKLVYTRENQ